MSLDVKIYLEGKLRNCSVTTFMKTDDCVIDGARFDRINYCLYLCLNASGGGQAESLLVVATMITMAP